ncbi:hypothetical protein D0865_07561 [Hortaea werneckii]|uniref:Uncharacterized protein n=1 Tax=Hortaea werneckii TaxID=91943 RepID=A0A3M7CB47_HORWE|nr:hypothetical protein D0865_07561 [Hortaea werneckii]
MVTSEECSRLLVSGAKIKPDADISGIGVILAFLITAYASFVAILAAYICGMVERELLSLADVKVMRIRPRTERHPRMHRILRQTIIVLSDQQIVTGIAIMTAGFVGLRSGQISVYHYQIVLYLAWLSSSVHLSALTLLRPFLNRHAGVKVWRLVGMGALFIMLVIGLVPTVSYDWGIINFMDPKDSSIGENNLTGWGVPASCFWGKTYADGPRGIIEHNRSAIFGASDCYSFRAYLSSQFLSSWHLSPPRYGFLHSGFYLGLFKSSSRGTKPMRKLTRKKSIGDLVS